MRIPTVERDQPQEPGRRIDNDREANIRAFVQGFSIEVTVREAAEVGDFREFLPVGTEVYIPATPSTAVVDAVRLARRLRDEAMEPVPHVAARAQPDIKSLDRCLGLFTSHAGVRSMLVIAGGNHDQPRGPFASSLSLLRSGLCEQHGIRDIRFAAHPEGHPAQSDAQLVETLLEKQAFAYAHGVSASLVTQFFFDAAPVIDWDRRLANLGIGLPMRVGLHGVTSLASLLKQARYCGIGASVNFLMAQHANLLKLARPTTPDQLIYSLARHVRDYKNTRIQGCHFFPLGSFKNTAAWAAAIYSLPDEQRSI